MDFALGCMQTSALSHVTSDKDDAQNNSQLDESSQEQTNSRHPAPTLPTPSVLP
jgi:hypothetical protein